MALGLCRFTNAAGGTVDWTYPGPAIDMQSPASAGAVNGTIYEYYAQSLDMAQWEIGTGAYNSASGVFARTTVLANSLGTTAKVSFTNPPQIAIYDLFTAPAAVLYNAQSLTAGQQAQARSNIAAAPAITTLTASLGANVALNNVAAYFDGPSVSQGTTGTWLVTATVTVSDTVAASFFVKLWDGATVIASAFATTAGNGFGQAIPLSGIITNPVGNLRVSVKDVGTVNGKIIANTSGNAKDSTITAVRIA